MNHLGINYPSSQKSCLSNELTIIQHSNDRDNGLDSILDSESSSLRSVSLTLSIRGYRYENGRRYHVYQDRKYLLPNDESKQNRLDFYHHIWRLILRGN